RSNAPQDRAESADALDSETVEQQTGRQLARCIGPAVGAQQVSKRHDGDAEGGVQGVVGDRKVDPVEVVHQDAEAKQAGDEPAPARNRFVGEWRDRRNRRKEGEYLTVRLGSARGRVRSVCLPQKRNVHWASGGRTSRNVIVFFLGSEEYLLTATAC